MSELRVLIYFIILTAKNSIAAQSAPGAENINDTTTGFKTTTTTGFKTTTLKTTTKKI